jgi:hypothetical protein
MWDDLASRVQQAILSIFARFGLASIAAAL